MSILIALPVSCSDTKGNADPDDTARTAESDTPSVVSGAQVVAGQTASTSGPGDPSRAPNELGRIPVLEYHLIGEEEGRWQRSHARFRRDLELLYRRGYRPVTISQILDRDLNLPAGLSPVVLVFDDASPGQFRYIERNGRLEIDPNSAVGILTEFNLRHPDWTNSAVFCTLSGAEAGRSLFGDKGIEGQKSEWRFPKLRFLAERGFELCNHTLWHANLGQYDDAFVQEQIARGVMAIDSAVPGYKVRAFALPLGIWPRNRALAKRGSWRDPGSGRVVTYDFDAILEVSGGPTRSPYDPKFNPLSINRVQVFGEELERTLDALDRPGARYVSDGMSNRVAQPATQP
jgi:peptidoglycan/xylan/chitin deacetylase (PgdA/CDA1 family)